MSDSHTFQERLPDLTGKTVWAIDTLSRVYQLFHALPEMSSPDGTPVGAVYGFARDLLDVVENKRPDYLVCAIDAPGPTFRHERFEAYKATRAAMPADLVPQIDLVRRLLFVMDIPALEITRFEADDILATIATRTVIMHYRHIRQRCPTVTFQPRHDSQSSFWTALSLNRTRKRVGHSTGSGG